MRSLTRKITRRSDASMIRDKGHLKALVATLYPNGVLGLRPEKSRRKREEVITLEACYQHAVKQRVAKERREKAEAKQAKRLKGGRSA